MIHHPTHGFLPWAADRAQAEGLFHVAALIRIAMDRIDELTASNETLAAKLGEAVREMEAGATCDGCVRAPLPGHHYDMDCGECCRFYGDLYDEEHGK